MSAFLKIAGDFLMKQLKKLAKKYAQDKASESGILKVILISLLCIVIAIPILLFSLFGSLMCTIVECEDDTNKQEDVISIGMLKDVSSRMENLRMEVNNEASNKGENYGTFKARLFENDEKQEPLDTQEKVVEQIESNKDVPTADHNVWVTGDKQGLNAGFLNRLAAIAQANGKKVSVTSGHRSIEEQKRLYEGYIKGLPGFNKAAKPGKSRHNYGLAADVSGWLQQMPESSMLMYGLHKPVSGENWHVEPRETKGKTPEQLAGVKVDGTGATITGGAEGGNISEAYVHLLALQQSDETEMIFLDKETLDAEEKEGTNMGKTWKLAKALRAEIKKGTYKDSNIVKRAKSEEWGTRQYVKLARWEIHKCFLLGNESKDGFWENILGGPKPCDDIKRLTGEEIVPGKLQGMVSKVTKKGGQTTVVYQDVQEILYKYGEISLYKEPKTFKPIMKEIIEILFERFAAPSTLDDGGIPIPNFIVPLQTGTYTVETRYGQDINGQVSKGIFLKTSHSIPVYSSISGKVVGLYKDETGGYSVIVENSSYGFVENKGLKDVVVKKGTSIQQGQLIGATFKDKLLEFRTCNDVATNVPKPTCKSTTDPENGDAKLSFISGIDSKTSAKSETDYPKLKAQSLNGKTILMPGFSNMSTLGQLSKKYESSGDPGKCVHNAGDAGGLSCGSYQIAKAVGTLGEYMKYLQKNFPSFYKVLAPVPQNLKSFGPVWRSTYNSDKNGFYQSQHDFIGSTHYVPVTNEIKSKYGFDVNTRSRSVQEMFWSYSVQHRNNTVSAFGKVIGKSHQNLSDKEIITRMYDYRIVRWSCCTTRFVNEKRDALAMLGQ